MPTPGGPQLNAETRRPWYDGVFRMLVELVSPLGEYLRQPMNAVLWIAAAIGLGTYSLWILPIASPERPGALDQAIRAGNLASFCVILLADMVAWEQVVSRRRQEDLWPRARSLARTAAVACIAIQAVFYYKMVADTAGLNENQLRQLVDRHIRLAWVSIGVAMYLFCFRLREFAPTAEIHEEQQNRDVKQVGITAAQTSATSDGIEL